MMQQRRLTRVRSASRGLWRGSLWSALLLLPGALHAQGTLDDYRRAATITQRFNNLTVGLVQGGTNWINNTNKLWYRVTVRGGAQFVLVDADAWTKQPAFDHARLATALSSAASGQYTAITLPFSTFTYSVDLQSMEADVGQSRYRCTLTDYACTRTG